MSTTTTPTALSSLLRRPEGALLPLLKKADLLRGLNDTLSQEFDSTLAKHCRAVNMRGSVLVLAVDSAAWATRLRFQTTDLVSQFRAAGFPGLSSVEIVILPPNKDLAATPAPSQARLTALRPPAPVCERIAQILASDVDALPPEISRRMRNLVNSYTKMV